MRRLVDTLGDTGKTYGFLWERSAAGYSPDTWHFNAMQSAIGEPIVTGKLGIEVGSGCGYDTYIMAKNNPSVEFVSIDISDGIYRTKERVAALGNVFPVKCSALDICAKEESFDFAYSFGVLHHTSDPRRGLSEIARVLKKGRPTFIYLYEDHAENFMKYVSIKIVSLFRILTTRLPKKALYALVTAASPFAYLIFTVPSKILGKFERTQRIAAHMPFNFGKGPFSLRGDLYDRFGAPVERRFSKQDVFDIFKECGFINTNVTRLKDTAGWVAWGYKSDA